MLYEVITGTVQWTIQTKQTRFIAQLLYQSRKHNIPACQRNTNVKMIVKSPILRLGPGCRVERFDRRIESVQFFLGNPTDSQFGSLTLKQLAGAHGVEILLCVDTSNGIGACIATDQQPRITSYNVCYTKLLRAPNSARARNGTAPACSTGTCSTTRCTRACSRNNFV